MGKEWIAECIHCWGRAGDEYGAVANMSLNLRSVESDTVEVWITECEGFEGGSVGHVDADVIHTEKTLEMPVEKLEELAEVASEAEMAAEAAIVESEVIE